MNLLAIIIIFLALATAGAVIYAAWELSSDKPARRTGHSAEVEDPDGPPEP
jgi:flagellar basal body-associated protein FliL